MCHVFVGIRRLVSFVLLMVSALSLLTALSLLGWSNSNAGDELLGMSSERRTQLLSEIDELESLQADQGRSDSAEPASHPVIDQWRKAMQFAQSHEINSELERRRREIRELETRTEGLRKPVIWMSFLAAMLCFSLSNAIDPKPSFADPTQTEIKDSTTTLS